MSASTAFIPFNNTASNDTTTTEPPVLLIDSFSPRVVLDFGDVTAGKTAITALTINNPQSEDIEIQTVKFPKSKAISLHGYDYNVSRTRVYRVPQLSCIDVNISWSPDVTQSGGMRELIELEWERKKFQVTLVGFILEVKNKKRVVKRVLRRNKENRNVSPNNSPADSQRFKGIARQTSMEEKAPKAPAEKKPVKVLGERQRTECKVTRSARTRGRQPVDNSDRLKIKLDLQSKLEPVKSKEEENGEEAVSPFAELDTPTAPQPITTQHLHHVTCSQPITTQQEEAVSPFAELDTPTAPQVKEVPTVAPPTPVPVLVRQKTIDGSSSDGGSGTPRKRKTWGAPRNDPLCHIAPSVPATRAAVKRAEEQVTVGQTTFMECHSVLPADSMLADDTSPTRYEKPLAAPFTPPNQSTVGGEGSTWVAGETSTWEISPAPEKRSGYRGSGGPLTATPLHPSMVVNSEVKTDALPCFDTSIIPHSSPRLSSAEHRKSENFVIPAIETTSSTVNLSEDDPNKLADNPKETTRPVASKKSGADTKKQSNKKTTNFQVPAAKAKKTEQKVHFKAPQIRSTASSAAARPKSAPGGAAHSRLHLLKKAVSHEVPRRGAAHSSKRRSVSADRGTDRIRTPAPDFSAAGSRPPKRKDLVTPNMVPPKSPNKRPLHGGAVNDVMFREKRHKSCDTTTPRHRGTQKSEARRSVVVQQPVTRIKLHQRSSRNLTALPRHPSALSTATNIFFDEKWKLKQQRGFTVWMNYHLCPPEGSLPPQYQRTRDIQKAQARKARKSMAVLQVDKAKHFAKLQAERKLLQAGRRACAIFQSAELVLLKLEKEINDGGLVIRTDRKLDADLGLKDQLVDLLLCYNPIWLRLGLEVLYEEILPLAHHQDLPGIVTFLIARFVNNPNLAQKYAHSTVPGSYGTGYEEELRKFTLKKFLMLVLLLDMAKTARILEHDPCLFCINSPHKASRSLLFSFNNSFLSGEGDVTRHLHYIGYTVQHEQKHIDEVDYTVKNMATELRDGTSLTRLVEIVTETALTDKLRVPANSRLQKVHNMTLMINAIQEEGVRLDKSPGGPIVAKSIVDGNQTQTLALIWRIIFQHCLSKILVLDRLKAEVEILVKALKKQRNNKSSNYENEEDFVLGLPVRRLSVDEKGFFLSEVVQTLLQWCQTVCSYYDVTVDNFTVSFSDGRVLCLLVHHYHPDLIPYHAIQHNTSLAHRQMELDVSLDFLTATPPDPAMFRTNERENFRLLSESLAGLREVPAMIFANDMVDTIPDERVVITFVAYLCAGLVDISQEFRAAQKLQRAWRRFLHLRGAEEMREKRRQIIKVQALARALFARKELEQLKLDRDAIMARKREYAARVIQHNWRTIDIMKAERACFGKKRESAVKIQRFYRAILEIRWAERRRLENEFRAASKIQAVVRGTMVRQGLARKQQAAKIIQVHYRYVLERRWKERMQREMERQAATRIQALFRGSRTRQEIAEKHRVAGLIQGYYRSYRFMKQERAQYLTRRRKAIVIQSSWRRKVVQRQFSDKKIKTIKIQSTWKMWKAKREFEALKRSAVEIQKLWRNYQTRKRLREEKIKILKSVLLIQSHYRGYQLRSQIVIEHKQATKIQSYWRMWTARQEFKTQRTSSVKIQRAWRIHQVRERIREEKIKIWRSILMIQSHFRGKQLRSQIVIEHNQAIKIQSYWRMWTARQEFETQRTSSVKIQRAWRIHQVRERIREEKIKVWRSILMIQSHFRGKHLRCRIAEAHEQATKIQACVRGYVVRKRISAQHCAAALIQQYYHGYQCMRETRCQYLLQRSSCIIMQSHIRSYLVRKDLAVKAAAATKIQAAYRGHAQRSLYLAQQRAALCIQTQYRAWRQGTSARDTYLALRAAVLLIQSVYRGVQTRRMLRAQRGAAVQIQAQWRMYRARCEYLAQQAAAVRIQASWRMYRQQCAYQEIRRSVVRIQAAYRMYDAATHYRTLRRSAVQIQAQWRAYSQTRRYRTTRNSVVSLQALYRGCLTRQLLGVLRDIRGIREQMLSSPRTFSLQQMRRVQEGLSEAMQ